MDLEKQMKLLRLRRQASRIALRLFEACRNQADIDEANQWFERCNAADNEADVLIAIEHLRAIAHAKNIPIDL